MAQEILHQRLNQLQDSAQVRDGDRAAADERDRKAFDELPVLPYSCYPPLESIILDLSSALTVSVDMDRL